MRERLVSWTSWRDEPRLNAFSVADTIERSGLKRRRWQVAELLIARRVVAEQPGQVMAKPRRVRASTRSGWLRGIVSRDARSNRVATCEVRSGEG